MILRKNMAVPGFVGYALISIRIIMVCFGWKAIALQEILLLVILFIHG